MTSKFTKNNCEMASDSAKNEMEQSGLNLDINKSECEIISKDSDKICNEDVESNNYLSSHKNYEAEMDLLSEDVKDDAFVWDDYLEFTQQIPVSDSIFKYLENNLQSPVTSGMVLEIRNENSDTYWPATVLIVCSTLLRVRYWGCDDHTLDFWCELDSSRVKPLNYSKFIGLELKPPENILSSNTNIVSLIEELKNCLSLPLNNDFKSNDLMAKSIKEGMKIEVIDKWKPNTVWTATVLEVVGERLHIRYDTLNSMDDFWLFSNSRRLHYFGWTEEQLDYQYSPPYQLIDTRSSPEWEAILEMSRNEANYGMAVTKDLLPTTTFDQLPDHRMKIGMKLESINLNRTKICLATVVEIFDSKYFVVKIDGCDDKWLSNMIDPSILPYGWCCRNKNKFNIQNYFQVNENKLLQHFDNTEMCENIDLEETEQNCFEKSEESLQFDNVSEELQESNDDKEEKNSQESVDVKKCFVSKENCFSSSDVCLNNEFAKKPPIVGDLEKGENGLNKNYPSSFCTQKLTETNFDIEMTEVNAEVGVSENETEVHVYLGESKDETEVNVVDSKGAERTEVEGGVEENKSETEVSARVGKNKSEAEINVVGESKSVERTEGNAGGVEENKSEAEINAQVGQSKSEKAEINVGVESKSAERTKGNAEGVGENKSETEANTEVGEGKSEVNIGAKLPTWIELETQVQNSETEHCILKGVEFASGQNSTNSESLKKNLIKFKDNCGKIHALKHSPVCRGCQKCFYNVKESIDNSINLNDDDLAKSDFSISFDASDISIGQVLEVVNPQKPSEICVGVIVFLIDHIAWIRLLSFENGPVYIISLTDDCVFPFNYHPSHGYAVKKPWNWNQRVYNEKKRNENINVEYGIDKDEQDQSSWCPKLFFNTFCFSGPFLKRSLLFKLPKTLGPGPVSVVVKEAIGMLITCGYNSGRILRELQRMGLPQTKYAKDVVRAKGVNANLSTIRLPTAMYQVREYFETFFRYHVRCCPRLVTTKFLSKCPYNCQYNKQELMMAYKHADYHPSAAYECPELEEPPTKKVCYDESCSNERKQVKVSNDFSLNLDKIKLEILQLDKDPLTWNVLDVVRFLKKSECSHLADIIKKEEIDGVAFMLLNMSSAMEFLDLSEKDSLALCNLIANVNYTFFKQFVFKI